MVDYTILIQEAFAAQSYAYAPYSNFRVGAALLGANGVIYRGCNIENAAFTPTNCAERTAFFKAVSQGQTDFKAIAIVGGRAQGEAGYTAPCGVCRQVMREFCRPQDFKVILAKNLHDYIEFTLEELFPMGFGPDNLNI